MTRLTSKIINGLLWNGGLSLTTALLSMFVKLLLARLLDPVAFGLVGMAVVFTGLFEIINERGFSQPLIQMDKNKLQERHYFTAFSASLILGGTLFTIVALALAPLISIIYSEPELYSVVVAISVSLLFRPFNIIPTTILTRQLNFKRKTIIEFVSVIIASGISIYMALKGFGVFSLAFLPVFQIMISLPLYRYSVAWKMKLSFNKEAFKDIFSFGIYVTGNGILVHLTKHLDYLIIGLMLSSKLLGIYTLAFILTDVIRQRLMGIVNKVMFPAYSQIQENVTLIKSYYSNVIFFNSLFLFPICLVYISLSEEILLIFFGEEWILGSNVLILLSIGVMIHSIGGSASYVLRSMGYAKLEFKLSIIETLVLIIALIPMIYFYGINGAAVAIVLGKLVSRIIYQYHLKQKIGISDVEIAKIIAPLIAIVFVVTTMIYWIKVSFITITDKGSLLVVVIIGIVLYAFFTLFFCRNKILPIVTSKFLKK